MTSSNQLAVSSVEFRNAKPALLQLWLQKCVFFYYLSKKVSSINKLVLGFLCRANGCVNVTLWLLSRIINHANVQKGLKTFCMKNILYIQVKLELSENLAIALLQPCSCNTKAKF